MQNFLKSLELQGFKSFAAKTSFEFPARVTAIVGPNGSGKSNIIDAMRWVLGEREAKQLRGGTLENLIFAGTPKRAAQGFAKVSLCFDNAKKTFPIESPEVAVSRRVDRSGVSEFAWNDMEVRLKDLLPVFARARLGARGLNMIGQGESDIFVRSNPEERRLMIEEILGLREFRIKKNQAERRLESSEVNMEKVAVTLEELGPHLRMLRRQKNRFDKRSEIETELRDLENKYFGRALSVFKTDEEQFSVPLRKAEEDYRDLENEIKKLEEEIRLLDKKNERTPHVRSLREKIASKILEKSGYERELTRLQTKREFLAVHKEPPHSALEMQQNFEDLSREMESWLQVNDIETLRGLLRHWLQKIAAFIGREGEVKSTDGEEKILKEKITVLEAEVESLRKEEERMLDLQDSLNKEFRIHIEDLEKKKSALRLIEQEIQRIGFEKEKIKIRLSELEREWHAAGRQIHDLKELKDFSGELDYADAERRMLRFRGELSAIGETDPNLIKEATETEERYVFLERELEDLKKASLDLKGLIRDLDEKIHEDFKTSFHELNAAFNEHFQLMFGGGRAKMKIVEPPKLEVVEEENVENEAIDSKPSKLETNEPETRMAGVEIELHLPKKKIHDLNMLSGGEKSLVSLAALFALIAVSPPPFLVLDEIDAALDDENARRFAGLIKEFSKKTQFVIVTHNRSTMEAADVLYGVTMEDDGVSKVLSLKLEEYTETGGHKNN